ncbi:NADPH-dependent F420 reductase [Micrococcus sp. 2A]|uniref:NADPH-dependent F420 reductase n=1 Tax=Micrococcus sp. 2A TaxID=3142261 RepID=UPI00261D5AF3|nr:NADPH-dependent F420 reductase [uncultured Micrococcus sp.]
MTTLSIIGDGTMGTAIAEVARRGGHDVTLIGRDGTAADITGEIVVLALPYPALSDVITTYAPALEGKVVVDITNPLDFDTFDSLQVPADSSAAAEVADALPNARVLKAFNTTFAAVLSSGRIGDQTTTVLIAGDDADAKSALADVVTSGGLNAIDAGALKRARELEAVGFLQLTLAAAERIGWTGGFATVR